MGIDLFEPLAGSEQKNLARLFEEFSEYVLNEERERCLQILQDDIDSDGAGMGASVGELQGGNDSFSIYRVSFPDSDDDDSRYSSNAAVQLLNEFNRNNYNGNGNRNMHLTTRKIKQYMLGMCDRRYTREREECIVTSNVGNTCRKYTSLGNLMFIMQFGGPTEGQVRHIDNMVPNIQICLYMSSSCPSTIVYAMDDYDEDGEHEPVANGGLLVKYWERHGHTGVPELIKDILWKKSDRKLKGKWYTKYFAFWNTIDSHLACFGKLYQPVSFQLGMQTVDPGTTLLAGGNEVHAGPPTMGPRMFAFAIGIPEESSAIMGGEDLDKGNDGEVQYSPVLLHIDFCCLLFSLLDHEYSTVVSADSVKEAKLFLLEILLHLIGDYPMKGYLRQIDDERIGVRNWLEKILDSLDNKRAVEILVTEAMDSDEIFFSPDVIKRRSKKKKRRNVKGK